eukprot:5410277-Amphidinium_carterae.1
MAAVMLPLWNPRRGSGQYDCRPQSPQSHDLALARIEPQETQSASILVGAASLPGMFTRPHLPRDPFAASLAKTAAEVRYLCVTWRLNTNKKRKDSNSFHEQVLA